MSGIIGSAIAAELGPIGAATQILAHLPKAHNWQGSVDGHRVQSIQHAETNIAGINEHASFTFTYQGKSRTIEGTRPLLGHKGGGTDEIVLDGKACKGTIVLAKHIVFLSVRLEIEFKVKGGSVYRFDATVEGV